MVLDLSELTLWTSPDKFFFVSEDKPGQLLIIDRITHTISLERNRHQIPMTVCSRTSISGILGILDLISGPHLVVITSKSKIGHLTSDNHAIWKLDEAALIPFARSDFHLSPAERFVSEDQRKLVDTLFHGSNTSFSSAKCFFYFSHTLDLTNTRQRLDNIHENYQGPSHLLSTVSESFTWNLHLLKTHFLPRPELHSWVVPLVEGACFVHQCSLNGKLFRWTILSRRSTKMAGTRFNRRGADESGYVANFVETEQLVEHDDVITSFVQTRGSMPMYWSQIPDLSYLPQPVIFKHQEHINPFIQHFQKQFVEYGHQIAINLINHTKGEGNLERLYRNLHSECLRLQVCFTSQQVPNLNYDQLDPRVRVLDYEPFDFHANCPNFQSWSKLGILIDKIRPRLIKFGFYSQKTRGGSALFTQKGVIRTNCMDCLDRTNVAQSLVAWENLIQVLNFVGILKPGESLGSHLDFQQLFRNVWSDHANILALQYVGSRALKTDFTRTGQRSVQGALADLRNALVRYWSNNFADGRRQDAINLFLGHAKADSIPVDETESLVVDDLSIYTGYGGRAFSILRLNKKSILRSLPLALIGTLSLLFLTFSGMLLVSDSDVDDWVPLKHFVLILMFLTSTSIFIVLTIKRYSSIYVDKPRYLSQPPIIIQ